MEHLPFVVKAGPSKVPYFQPRVFATSTSNGSGPKVRKGPDHLLEDLETLEDNDDILDLTDDELQEEILAIVQQRLYFDTLDAIFSITELEYQEDDFLKSHDDDHLLVTTSELQRYIFHWHVLENENATETRRDHWNKCISYLKQCIQQLVMIEEYASSGWLDIDERELGGGTEFYERSNPFSKEFPRAGVVALSIRLLYEALTHSLDSVFREFIYLEEGPWKELPHWGANRDEFPFTNYVPLDRGQSVRFLEHLLQMAGWCPREIHHMYNRSNSLSSWMYRLRHMRCSEPGMHARCSSEICLKNRLDQSKYSTLHRPGCSGCESIAIDSASILRATGNFAIRLRQEATLETADLLSKPYVAISHVWADGMGNTTANALPTCVLEYLQVYSNAAYKVTDTSGVSSVKNADSAKQEITYNNNIPFWIDTLCVPVGDLEARNIAIRNMSSTYRQAKIVLVLDSSITKEPAPPTSLDRVLSIAASTWSQRLWTFQEGQVASNIAVAYLDEVVPSPVDSWYDKRLDMLNVMDLNGSAFQLDETMQPQRRACATKLIAAAWMCGHDEAKELLRPLRELSDVDFSTYPVENSARLAARLRHFHMGLPNNVEAASVVPQCSPKSFGRLTKPWQRLWPIIFALRVRTTSRIEDEPLCLGSVLDIDINMLLDLPPEQRMKQILIEVQYLPKRFLYFTGERLQEEGSRWVPKSLLAAEELYSFSGMGEESNYIPEEILWQDETSLLRPSVEGLRVRSRGVLVSGGWSSSLFRDGKGVFTVDEKNDLQAVIFTTGEAKGRKLRIRGFEERELAIIVQPRNAKDVADATLFDGVLLSVAPSDASDVIHGRFESLCLFGRNHSNVQKDQCARSKWLDDNQEWLVL